VVHQPDLGRHAGGREPAMSMTRAVRRLLPALAALAVVACGPTHSSRYQRKQAQKSLAKLETPGVVIGEFHLTKVTDGDTVRVDGLDSALRLLGIDCEETFKSETDRRMVEADWQSYLKTKRGTSKRPVKMATPLGEQAKLFGKEFFKDSPVVRIERDDARQIRDRYNRYLAYVFAKKNGAWVNYNVEVVRAGMSPYFAKYGYSVRFHDEFVAAEAEARAAQRGIWAPGAMAAQDYDERAAWWNARGDFVRAWQRDAAGKPDHLMIDQWDIMARLEERVGREVTLLGTVGEIRYGDRGPTRVMMSRRMFSDLPLIFWDKDVFVASGVAGWKSEYISVTGQVTVYENKHTRRKQLQIVIDRPSQIRLSPIPGLTMPEPAAAPAPAAAAAPAQP
jgi:endonuclease YncB( thermonuclease family)